MPKLTLDLPIYTFQIDFSGHVSNLIYVQWLEVCRLTLLETAGVPVHTAATEGVLPVLTDTVIAYKAPLYLGDRMHAEFWVSELRGASAWVEYRIYNQDGVLCASARQRGLWVDAGTKRPARISAEQRALYAPFLGEE
jgi:acyl-CoA thioester hydrolase